MSKITEPFWLKTLIGYNWAIYEPIWLKFKPYTYNEVPKINIKNVQNGDQDGRQDGGSKLSLATIQWVQVCANQWPKKERSDREREHFFNKLINISKWDINVETRGMWKQEDEALPKSESI